MGCVLLIGDCGPLKPEFLRNLGHELIFAPTAADAWDYLLSNSSPSNPPVPDFHVSVIGRAIEEIERQKLLRWMEEETNGAYILVGPRSQSGPLAYGYYDEKNSSDEALQVVTTLLDGMARNCM